MPPEDSDQARWFAAEIEPHAPALRAYLQRRFPSIVDVDDLVQESFVRVIRAYAQGGVRQPRALLFTSARNLAIDLVRRQGVVQLDQMAENADSSVFIDDHDVVESISRKQELELLTRAIESLPSLCRQVMTLRSAYGLPYKQIAAQLGITENVVEKKMIEGVRRCSAFFARHRGV